MTQHFGYIEAVHYAAAKLKVMEYIANAIEVIDIGMWDFIHTFDDDAASVTKVGLYEHMHDPYHLPPPLAVFYLVRCLNGCYRLPTENEEEFLHGKTTVSA